MIKLQAGRRPAETRRPEPSVVGRLRDSPIWIIAPAAALFFLVIAWTPSYWVGVLAAVALPLVLARHAVALTLFTAFAAQEAVPRPGVGAVTTFGHQAIYAGKVPLIVILAMTAAVLTLVRLRSAAWRALDTLGRLALGVIAALGCLSIVIGFIDGQSLFSAINQNARPFVVLAVGLVLGVGLGMLRGEERAATYASSVALVGLAAAVGLSVAMGHAADARVSPYFVFYDAALPAAAMAIFLALLGTRRRPDWRQVLVMAATLLIVVASFRLTVWAAAAVTIAIAVLLSRQRLISVRRLAVATAGLAVLLVVTPGLATDVSARLFGASSGRPAQATGSAPAEAGTGSASAAGGANTGGDSSGKPGALAASAPPATIASEIVSGTVAADSAGGHVSDIRVGWDYVEKNFWTGIGPRAPQPPGLAAAKSQRVYVHNEWLLDWLRFGPLAALLVTALLAIVAVASVRTLRRLHTRTTERAAAVFGLTVPVCLAAFPYLTTSTRWPLFLGISVGLLGLRRPAGGRHREKDPITAAVAPGPPM